MEAFEITEGLIRNTVQWLRLGVETIGVLVIALGVARAMYAAARALFTRHDIDFNSIRLLLARHLGLALEFQLGADILSTAIAPGWNQIGKLAAIAVIRTVLNYFLSLEMKEEQRQEEETRMKNASG